MMNLDFWFMNTIHLLAAEAQQMITPKVKR